jgi:hypothetical protein
MLRIDLSFVDESAGVYMIGEKKIAKYIRCLF